MKTVYVLLPCLSCLEGPTFLPTYLLYNLEIFLSIIGGIVNEVTETT